MTAAPLPIDSALPELLETLEHRTAAVLQAPPGAGKTTHVPLALLEAAWRVDRRVLMLEPRRLAARAAAYRMSDLLGERVGGRVGYRTRLDSQVSAATRIEVVTEGILTRMLADDPTLDDVAIVIFDEFHERSVQADVGLALSLHSQALVRPDLRILVMSATLDGAAVSALLGNAPIVTSEGRLFPVETRYVDPRGARLEDAMTAAVERALRSHDGDVLAFLPGAGEIRRVEARLREQLQDPHVDVAPLFGNLPREAQDLAILPSSGGRRKVVLATAIAETSLTIEGVRVVIDSGVARVPRFSPRTGMTRLETVRVSLASADQRRGRAGRVAPGVAYRLWPEHETPSLRPRTTPEILEADLAPVVLDLAAIGIADPSELQWLDQPPTTAVAQATELLIELQALDANHRITAHGQRMSHLGVHPRLAHMLLRAAELDLAPLAADVAALLGERDVLRTPFGVGGDADIRLRLEALLGDDRGARSIAGLEIDRDGLRRVRAEADQLRRMMRVGPRTNGDVDQAGALLALAYPDRVAQRREPESHRYLLRNGRGAAFASPQALAREPYLVVAAVDDQRPESRIHLAAPITLEEIERAFADQVTREQRVDWNEATSSVTARERDLLGAIVLRERLLPNADAALVSRALVAEVRRRGLELLTWSDSATKLRERVAFLRRQDPSWPDWSDEALLAGLDAWLGARLTTPRGRLSLASVDVHGALLDQLTWKQRAQLDELAPTHVEVPSGSRIPVDYGNADAPVLAVRLQEMFGLADTPRIAGGRVPLTLHLLSPAHRPVQVTRDLAGFWRSSYFDVRKDMRGRYPKHYWPDDPLVAEPTRRAKPRR